MIKIFTTGGTIGGIDNETSISVKILSFLDIAGVTLDYNLVALFEKDSRHITLQDREFLKTSIINSKENKILITHGTFTMSETAEYLGKLGLDKTIVLTGSFILGSKTTTDAPFNLGYAICSLQFLKPGVYIAMNGQIFNWQNVTKNLETNKFECKDD